MTSEDELSPTSEKIFEFVRNAIEERNSLMVGTPEVLPTSIMCPVEPIPKKGTGKCAKVLCGIIKNCNPKNFKRALSHMENFREIVYKKDKSQGYVYKVKIIFASSRLCTKWSSAINMKLPGDGLFIFQEAHPPCKSFRTLSNKMYPKWRWYVKVKD